MRKIIAVSLMLCLASIPLLETAAMPVPLPAGAPLLQENYAYQNYAPDQLDNLLAPIALYPDPLLAQVFPAATFVDQVQQAADWVRSNGLNGIDYQNWDVSVKAVAHYPMVIGMMGQRVDWTTSIGQAYVNQSTDVMQSVQRLRGMARLRGNLYSTPQQAVIYQGGYIQIVPAQPQYIYVPTYNPQVVYVQPHTQVVAMGAVIGFGTGLMIGAWLSRDCDWAGGRVYYDGWQGGGGGGWRQRSVQYVQVNNSTYVNNTYSNVTINKTVVNRTVNVTNINTYNTVHQNVTYNNVVHNNTVVQTHPFVANTPENRSAVHNPSAAGRPALQPNRPAAAAQPAARPAAAAQPAAQPAARPAPAAQPAARPAAVAQPAARPAPAVQPAARPAPAVQPAARPAAAAQPAARPGAAAQPAARPASAAQPAARPGSGSATGRASCSGSATGRASCSGSATGSASCTGGTSGSST